MLELAIHNPPRRTKKTAKRRKSGKAPSAAQLRARRAFAAMAKARSKKARKGKKSSRKKQRRVVIRTSTRRNITVGKSAKKVRARRRGRRRTGSPSARGFIPSDLLPNVGGALAGFIAVNKIPDYLPPSLTEGSVYKRITVKAGIAVGLYAALRAAGLRKMAVAVLTGGAVNVAYDLVKKTVPQIASTLGDYDENMGEMFLPGGTEETMGEMFSPMYQAA